MLIKQYFRGILKYLFPFGIFMIVWIGVTCNYICITHFNEIPIYFFAVYVTVSIMITIVILLVIPAAANFFIKSQAFLRQWRNYIKVNYADKPEEKKYLLASLKCCYPVKVPVGPFFVLKGSTTWKFVLFLLLHTMKAVIMFGKKKKRK